MNEKSQGQKRRQTRPKAQKISELSTALLVRTQIHTPDVLGEEVVVDPSRVDGEETHEQNDVPTSEDGLHNLRRTRGDNRLY